MHVGPCLSLAALTILGACAGSGPPRPAVLVPEPPRSDVETREAQLDNDFITVRLHIPPTAEARKPAVISMLGDRAALLRQGLLVVTYRTNGDTLNPPASRPTPMGSTVGKWVLASPSAAVLGQEYLRFITLNANEVIPKIMDYLVTIPEVDPARIGIAGGSTNGFIALQAVARDRRLSVASVLDACADYHRFLQLSSMGMEGHPLELAPDYDRWLRAQEVIRFPGRVAHAAVLMVNHRKDSIIPIACADETARVLAQWYAGAGVPERFRYGMIEAGEHGLGPEAIKETLAWFQRWFAGPGRPDRPRGARARRPFR